MIDVFKVGVHIGMSTNAGQILSVMLRELMGIHVAAGKVESRLGAIGKAALGAGAVFGGWMVIKGLIDATKHAEKLNHELVKLQTGAQLTDGQTNQASILAFKTSREVAGTNVADNVRMQRELFGVFGNMDEARELLPLVAQGSRATSAFVDKDTDLAKIAVRALELRGHITANGKVNPDEFKKEFESLVRSVVASEGLLDPAKLLAFIQQAGPAARGMNSDEFWGKAPAIMNAMGASKSGTAMMSLFSQMVGHVVAGARVATAMEEAGMLKHGSWHVGRGGKVEMSRNAVPEQAGFMDHPFTWLHDKLEALRKRPGMDEVGVIQRIFQFSSRATSARMISDIDKNWPIIQNEEARYKRMPETAAIAKGQNDKDLSVNIHNLNEAWDAFMAALGGPGIPIAIKVLHGLTDAINFMQAGIISHPETAKLLFELAGGIAAMTILGGGITIFMIAWSPFVGGIRLIVGLSGAIAATGTGLTVLASGITSLAAPIMAIMGILKLGSDSETPETRAALDKLNKARRGLDGGPNGPTHDGFNADGSPQTVYKPPGKQSSLSEPMWVHIANAGDIGRGMTGALSHGASRPQTGPTWQDYRMDAPIAGSALA